MVRPNVKCGLVTSLFMGWLFCNVVGQREGEPCVVDDGPGVCKLLSDCPYADRLVVEEMIKPKHCSYQGKWEVVCCPAEEIPSYALGRFGGFFSSTQNGKLVSEKYTCQYDGSMPIKCCHNTPDLPPPPEPQACPPVLHPAVKRNQKVWDKCVEYQRHVTPCVSSDDEPDKLVREDTCGQQGLDFRISNGEPAKEREFPHMALLGYRAGQETAWVAGGTLISDRYILTARHVLAHQKWGKVQYARLGMLLRSDLQNSLVFNVERRIHYKDKQRDHDIALLRLDRRVPLSPYVRPACLPMSDVKMEELTVTGWGRTGRNEAPSDALLKTRIHKFDASFCKQHIDRQGLKEWIDAQLICAGGANESGNDTCEGDSGGPMQVYVDEIHCMYAVVGVVSWGPECGQGAPAAYARVSFYLQWIVDTIW